MYFVLGNLFLIMLFVCVCREYADMVSVRYVDFSESDHLKSVKMTKDSKQAVRSSPQLVNEVAH